MMFNDWANSRYNTGGFAIDASGYLVDSNGYKVTDGTQYCSQSDTIREIVYYVCAPVTFTIDGSEYTTEKATPIINWVNSENNTQGYKIVNDYVYNASDELVTDNNDPVGTYRLIYGGESFVSGNINVTITLDNNNYTAKLVETFEQWVNSENNTAGYKIIESEGVNTLADSNDKLVIFFPGTSAGIEGYNVTANFTIWDGIIAGVTGGN